MTDNDWSYSHAATPSPPSSTSSAPRHKFIKPHCPWQNGKVERLNRTLQTEWAYRQVFTTQRRALSRPGTMARLLQPPTTPQRPRRPPTHQPLSYYLDSARAWVAETLGPLAAASERNEGLRETARVFLRTGGNYAATASALILHRNSVQYRVRQAEEQRGRPFAEACLDVELALLECHWLGPAILSAD